VDLVFDNIMSLNILEHNLFSFLYYPDEQRADIQFGYLNTSMYTGDMIWLPVIKHEHWTVKLKDIIIEGK
jgi:hypothetical protein